MVKKKNKKQNRRIFLTRLLIISVLVYFFIMTIPVIRTVNARTIPVEKDDVIDMVSSKGIVVRNEVVYNSETKGNVLFSIEEGEKLNKNAKVAEINNETYESYKNELTEVDREIEEYNSRISSQTEILKEDTNKNQDEIDDIVKQVQQNVAQQNYEEVKRLKDELLLISDNKDAITKDKTLAIDQLSAVMKKKSAVVEKMKQANLIYYAGTSGILSKTIDGFEEEYSSRKLDEYKTKDLKTLEVKENSIKDKDEIIIGKPIFKIIEDQEWYIMTKIQDDNLDDLKKGNVVSVLIDKDKNEIEGTIVKLEKSKKDSFLILKMNKHVHDFYKKRYVDLKIIKKTYSGLKVTKNAIVEKDDVLGVFIRDISGVVKFKPVKILKEMEDLTIVEPIDKDVRPLKLLDEVFVDGRKIKEGQIVNSKGGD